MIGCSPYTPDFGTPNCASATYTKQSDCPVDLPTYNPLTCECTCDVQATCTGEFMTFHPNDCTCTCDRDPATCPGGFLDEESCECVCPITPENCSADGEFKANLCACKCKDPIAHCEPYKAGFGTDLCAGKTYTN
jgi:hypothetical protein